MKVIEICGYSQGDFAFQAYYYVKIEDNNIILGRDIAYNISSRKRKAECVH